MSSTQKQRTKVFVSYSHEDEAWLRRLQVHMKPLIREGAVEFWDDTAIRPGSDWRADIQEAMESARVAVLFISADFLASEFIASQELPRLLRAAEEDGAIILPIIVSPSGFMRIPSLARFQSINPPSRPLKKMKPVEREEIFQAVAEAIIQARPSVPQSVREPARNSEDAPRFVKSAESQGSITQVDDKVLDLFNSLKATLGLLKDSTWDELSDDQKNTFEEYLLEQLEREDSLLDALTVLDHSGTKLSPTSLRAYSDRLVELAFHENPEVREKVAWEFRWLTQQTEPDQPEQVLCDLMDDDVPEVAHNALTSLGFVLSDDSPAEIWDEIFAKADVLVIGEDEVMIDAALFLYTKVLENNLNRANRRDLFPIILRSLDSKSAKIRHRTLWSLATIAPSLSLDDVQVVLQRVNKLLESEDAKDKARVLRFYEDLISPRFSFRFRTIDAEIARVAAAHILDQVLEYLDDDAQEVRYAAWSALGKIGRAVPRHEHARVLRRVIEIWEIDREVHTQYIAEVAEIYVGKIPEQMAEEIERYRKERFAQEMEVRRADRE